MFNRKALIYSVVLSALVGILVAFFASYFFAGWTKDNPLLMGLVIGAICGPIYAVIAGRQRS
jgi:ABC-type Fe3+-siderophore transport system permease subunit